jgi:hypothetical protein
MSVNFEGRSLSGEIYREYVFGTTIYRIDSPVALFIGTTTHRVLDGTGLVHCVPAPGEHGCVVRWLPKNPFSSRRSEVFAYTKKPARSR